MPPLIRPLRPLLQKRLPLATVLRASISSSGQLRTHASVNDEPGSEAWSQQPVTLEAATPQTITPETITTPSANPEDEIERVIQESLPKTGGARMPRSLAALYLKPLRRQAEYGVPSCDLQLRSYTLRNLEFFCDFALRAAYYLGLPAYGPVPLPRMTERWTVPRSSFIYKKSQENFERITLRRLIQIRDGHPDTVQVWLAFLQKHAYYGIGMKANVWEFSKLGVGKAMDESVKEVEGLLKDKWEHLGEKPRPENDTVEKIQEFLDKERIRLSHGR